MEPRKPMEPMEPMELMKLMKLMKLMEPRELMPLFELKQTFGHEKLHDCYHKGVDWETNNFNHRIKKPPGKNVNNTNH